jgi:hypothetical protein
MTRIEVRLQDLLGREVHDRDGRRAGRIEEFRAARTGEIVAVAIGAAGLLERLDLGARLILGAHARGKVARRDQIDLSDPKRPRLTCRVDELEGV